MDSRGCITLIGLVASLIGIVAFVTGRQKLADWSQSHDAQAASPGSSAAVSPDNRSPAQQVSASTVEPAPTAVRSRHVAYAAITGTLKDGESCCEPFFTVPLTSLTLCGDAYVDFCENDVRKQIPFSSVDTITVYGGAIAEGCGTHGLDISVNGVSTVGRGILVASPSCELVGTTIGENASVRLALGTVKSIQVIQHDSG